MLIIAFLVYGGSFFSEKESANTYIETEVKAEKQISEIEGLNLERQKEIEKLEN